MTHIFYTNPFFSVEDIAYLCPECIASGEAARKYDGSFQDDFSLDDGVDDPEKLASDLDALTRAIQGLSDDLRRGAAESREGQVDR